MLLERRVRTRGERFAALREGRGRARVVLEASTESEWVAQALETLGHEGIVGDPNCAPMYATRSRRGDDGAARGAHAGRRVPGGRVPGHASDLGGPADGAGAARRARGAGPDPDAVHQRAPRGAPTRRDPGAEWRGATFGQRVQTLPLSATQARRVAPLVALRKPLTRQLTAIEAQRARGVAANAAARRLCTVPGVGPVTAAAVVATLDDGRRCARAGQVAAYVGRVPCERSSGEQQRRGPLTKAGNSRVRWLLVQALDPPAWSARGIEPRPKAHTGVLAVKPKQSIRSRT